MDIYNSETRSRVMRSVHSKNTKPEVAVRTLLHSLGYRYRLHSADLPGSPDIVFAGRRKVIFIHGCFWHQHSGCKSADRPSANSDYWRTKLDRNMVRDRQILEALHALGWSALVIWECETRKAERNLLQSRLCEFLGEARLPSSRPKNAVPRRTESEV
jgi:DNA mismatch endonuclease (patch repair protein)